MTEYYNTAFLPSRFLLWPIGVRPFKNHSKPMICFFTAASVLANALTITGFFYEKAFMEIVDIIVTEVLIFNVILRVAMLLYYEKELKNIFGKMQKLWPITDPRLHTTLKYLKYLLINLIAQYAVWDVVMFAHGLFSGEQILHFHRPEMISETIFHIFVVDAYFILVSCVWFGCDLFFLTMSTVLLVQYMALNSSLQGYITSKGRQGYSMQDCMKQSNLLEGMIDKINTIFGPFLLIYIWLIIMLLGMLMYIIFERNSNPMDSFKYFILLIGLIIAILVSYVIPAQLLTNEINKMFNGVYCTNWYECSLPVKKSLLMILTKKETDAVIIAYGKLVKLNFKMCTSMFRTGFSFFTFLVHMKNSRTMDSK